MGTAGNPGSKGVALTRHAVDRFQYRFGSGLAGAELFQAALASVRRAKPVRPAKAKRLMRTSNMPRLEAGRTTLWWDSEVKALWVLVLGNDPDTRLVAVTVMCRDRNPRVCSPREANQ